MPKYFSLVEIRACFANEWVLIADPQVNHLLQLQGGCVLCHSSQRDEIDRYLRAHDVPCFVLLYSGANAPAEELALLDTRGYPPPPGPSKPARFWSGLGGWLVALVLAALVYLQTADSSLSVAAACVRAGWNELSSGW